MIGRYSRALKLAVIVLFLMIFASGCSFFPSDKFPSDNLSIGDEAVTMTVPGVAGEYSVIEIMARLVAAEARGEPEEGQIAVAAVILNRVESPSFPNTIAGVMIQNEPCWQFAPMKNAYELMFVAIDWEVEQAKRDGQETVLDRATRAIAEAQKGNDPTNGALFFRRVQASDYPLSTGATVIGNHIFSLTHI